MRADEQDPFDDDHGATPEELERAMGAAIGTPQGGAPPTASEDTDDLLADIHEVAEALRHPSHARAGTHRKPRPRGLTTLQGGGRRLCGSVRGSVPL